MIPFATAEPFDPPWYTVIGRALHVDATAITRIIASAAPRTVPMNEADVRRRIHEFEVARRPDGRVVGTAALRRLDRGRSELRGLAIEPEARGEGLGCRLALRAMARAAIEHRRVLAVSVRPAFFEALGFTRTSLAEVPAKPERPILRASTPRIALVWLPPDEAAWASPARSFGDAR